MTPKKLKITHQNLTLEIESLPSCSISDVISQTGKFYELEFLQALGALIEPKKWVVDVGAHIGNHTLYFAKALGLNVVAFEANPETFNTLKRNVDANAEGTNIAIQNLAICNSENVVSLSPGPTGDAGTYSILGKKNKKTVTCRGQLLDSFLEYFSTRPPGVIKFDIEGAEALAIEGAKTIIQIHEPIIATELIDISDFKAVSEQLTPLGYIPHSIHNATPTVIWQPYRRALKNNDKSGADVLDIVEYAISKSSEARGFRNQAINLEKKLSADETQNLLEA